MLKKIHLTKSAYVLLGKLSKQAMSGYQLKQLMAKIGRFYWSESNAQIYPILKKMEQQGLVNSAIDPESGGRQTRIYTITDLGMQYLLEWMRSQTEATPYREEILLKLSTAQHLSKKELKNMLSQYQQDIESQLADLQIVLEHIKEDHKDMSDQKYLVIIYDQVQDILKAKLKWCQRTISKL